MDERTVENAAASPQAIGDGVPAPAGPASTAVQDTTQAASKTPETTGGSAGASTAMAGAAVMDGDGAERRIELARTRAIVAAGRADAASMRPSRPRLASGMGRAGQRALLWLLLALPLLWLLARWRGGAVTYGDVVRWSGFWAALLLVPTTLVTPLGLLFPQARWVAWFRRWRHDLGLACLAYAMVHTAAYVIGKGSLGLILREGRQPWLLAGWATLAAFVVFAAVRARSARRGLGPSWTRRHRIIYVGAALVVLHWALSAFDPLTVQVQAALRAYGYYAGPIDGLIGPQSRQALSRLQRDRGLEVTGGITPEVLDVLGIVPN